MLNDKRIKTCISRSEYTTTKLIVPGGSEPLHSMGAHKDDASPATTSESLESPATAAALLMFALKGKYKISDQQSPIVARSLGLLRWTVAMLCCMIQWSISVQSSTVGGR